MSNVPPETLYSFYINGAYYHLDYNSLVNLPNLTKDSTPVEGSTNFITSGAVAEAVRVLSANPYTISDKNKLAGIEAGATKTLVDTVLSAESRNAIANSIVTQELQNLARRIERLENSSFEPSSGGSQSQIVSLHNASIDSNGIVSFDSGTAELNASDNLVFSNASASLSE